MGFFSFNTEETPNTTDGHVHAWELISKTYAAPQTTIQGIPQTLVEKALFGVTVLLWECNVCHELRKEEVLGTDENQLDTVLANAELLGPQYLERATGMFIVAKWQVSAAQPQQQAQNIPLR